MEVTTHITNEFDRLVGVGDKFVLSVLLNLADFWLIKYKLTFSFWCEEECTDFPFIFAFTNVLSGEGNKI